MLERVGLAKQCTEAKGQEEGKNGFFHGIWLIEYCLRNLDLIPYPHEGLFNKDIQDIGCYEDHYPINGIGNGVTAQELWEAVFEDLE